MSILSKEEIRNLVINKNLLVHFNESCVKAASYDLRCGARYYCPDPKRRFWNRSRRNFHSLKEGESFEIPSYQISFLEMKEHVKMPKNLTAKLGLRNSLLFRGIILGSQTQIDPGYEGPIWCMLHNVSNKSVQLRADEHVLTIEFNQLVDGRDTTKYDGAYGTERRSLEDALPDHTVSSATAEIDKTAKHAMRRLNTAIGSALVVLMIIVTAMAVISGLAPFRLSQKDLDNAKNQILTEVNQEVKKQVNENVTQLMQSQRLFEDRLRNLVHEELKGAGDKDLGKLNTETLDKLLQGWEKTLTNKITQLIMNQRLQEKQIRAIVREELMKLSGTRSD